MSCGFLRRTSFGDFIMVRITGIEPARQRHQILSLARLPVPPYPHIYTAEKLLLLMGFTIRNYAKIARAGMAYVCQSIRESNIYYHADANLSIITGQGYFAFVLLHCMLCGR